MSPLSWASHILLFIESAATRLMKCGTTEMRACHNYAATKITFEPHRIASCDPRIKGSSSADVYLAADANIFKAFHAPIYVHVHNGDIHRATYPCTHVHKDLHTEISYSHPHTCACMCLFGFVWLSSRVYTPPVLHKQTLPVRVLAEISRGSKCPGASPEKKKTRGSYQCAVPSISRGYMCGSSFTSFMFLNSHLHVLLLKIATYHGDDLAFIQR